jgi:hypothetical protein
MAAAKTRTTKKRPPSPQLVEKVAAMVESLLDPTAKVRHGVFLPDLINPPHKRQCDVVVEAGPKHRPTRTIVEVQRRGKKVEVGMFDGWVSKMHAVRAQHLVCVSSVGYPKSVVDKAAKLGPTVRLVTLKELESGTTILQGSLGGIVLRQSQTTDFYDIHFKVKDPARVRQGTVVGPKQQDPAFRAPSGEVLSLNQVAQRLVNNDPVMDSIPPGTYRRSYVTVEQLTSLHDEAIGPFLLQFEVDVVVHQDVVPCEVREYRQEEDALAWVLLGECPRQGTDRMHQIGITFRAGEDGRLVPHALHLDGFDPGDLIRTRVGPFQAGPILMPKPVV